MKKFISLTLSVLFVAVMFQAISLSVNLPSASAANNDPLLANGTVVLQPINPDAGGSGGTGCARGCSSGGSRGPQTINTGITFCWGTVQIPLVTVGYPMSATTCQKQILGDRSASLGTISLPYNATCAPMNGKSAWSIVWTENLVNKTFSYYCTYPEDPNPNTYIDTAWFYSTYDALFYQSENKAVISNGGAMASVPNNPQMYKRDGGALNGYMPADWGQFDAYRGQGLYGGATFALNTPENGGYGYYRMDLNARGSWCSKVGYQTWTGNHSADRIVCGGERAAGSARYYYSNSCSGYVNYGGNWASMPDNMNFAIGACEDFRCIVDGTLTINGTDTPLQVMRNGEGIAVKSPTIHIEHGSTSRAIGGGEFDIDGAYKVMPGSSPFNGRNPNDSNIGKQYFDMSTMDKHDINFLTNDTGPDSAWRPQGEVDTLVNFNWASSKNKSWNMKKTWRVNNAEFLVPVANSSDGSTSMQWQKEVKYCGEAISPAVTVVRSVNEAG